MRLQHFLSGIRDELPILVGVIPFGMIYGIQAMAAGLSSLDAQAMSSVVFAGSSQFMIIQLLSAQTPYVVIVLTGFVINLRHALYSASLAPHLRHLPPGWKMLLAYLLTDEAYAVSINAYQRTQDNHYTHWHLLGAGLALWTSWQISTAVGIFLGAQVPRDWGLDVTLALTFIALVVPALKDRPGVLAAVTAAVAALLFHGLPYQLGLIVASLLGISAGLWAESRQEKRP